MTIEQGEVVCRHRENLVGYTGTCTRCGQVTQYDPDSNKRATLVKRGRDPATGKPTMIRTPSLPPAEQAPATKANSPPGPDAPCPAVKPEDWARMTGAAKGRWYDEHWADFEADVKEVGLSAAQRRWGIANGTYRGIVRRHAGARAKAEGIPPPRPSRKTRIAMHRYYEANRGAILEDAKALGVLRMREKWGVPSSTWVTLRRRWTEGAGHAAEPGEQEPEALTEEDLAPVGATLARRNQGMTGIRRLYPL